MTTTAPTARLETVAQLFQAAANAHPDAPCITSGDRTWTYWNVAAQANALAVGLQNLGIESGDRVAVDLPNWPEFVISTLAVAELGAVLVPLNPGYSARELQFMLRNSEAVAAITAEEWGGVDYLQLFETLLVELPDLQYLVTVGEEDLWYDDRIFQFEDLVSSGRGREIEPYEGDPDEDPFAILYTPGTTGAAKGVVLTHRNVVESATATATALGLGPEDRTLCCVPMYHIFGLSAALLTTLATGSSLVLQDAFEADEALELAREHEATVLHGVPTMFVMMLRTLAKDRRPAWLRTGIIAGAPVAEELVRDVRVRLVPDLEIAYGLTETSPTVSITSPGDSEAKRSQTVGRPLPGIELKVLDEDGSELPSESVGELVVRGYNVMQGYFRQPGKTRNVMTEDEFLKTGDLAMLDPEGYLHIVGRSSDVIIRGGYNVHPGEIEAVLRSHPAVHEAAVLGIPNDVLGELICACVVVEEGALITEDELRDFCHDSLADYKVPDLVRFMDVFPEAPTEGARRVELARVVREGAETGSSEPV
ncbi:MAG: acyl--CoA ligase [Gemmatimonadetes bacterium]|nr:acyl--CoA ligase [Gemmatimonadota bacterium]